MICRSGANLSGINLRPLVNGTGFRIHTEHVMGMNQ